MDPNSAQNNNNKNPQGKPDGNAPPNPIEPGQFVVAGENHSTSPQASPNLSQPTGNLPPLDSQPSAPAAPTPMPAQPDPVPAPTSPPLPSTGLNLAGESPPPGPTADFPAPGPLPQAPAPEQPNPALYVPPPATGGNIPQNPSKIKNLKKIAIIVAGLVLLSAIGALVYMFVLGKKPQAAKTTTTDVIEEPSPSPQNTGPGFADLSESTPQATKSATPSASPKTR